jgi:hypothetical protein
MPQTNQVKKFYMRLILLSLKRVACVALKSRSTFGLHLRRDKTMPEAYEVSDESIEQQAAEAIQHLRKLMKDIAINEILRLRPDPPVKSSGGL